MPPTATTPTGTRPIATDELKPNAFSLSVYGDASGEIHDLVESIRVHGILVPLVVTPEASGWEVLSGHRRLACARALGLREVPCAVRTLRSRAARQRAVLEYNRQRRKTFSQLMREADALESWHEAEARRRRTANLRQFRARRSIVGIPTIGAAGPTRPSPGSWGLAARTSTARRAPSGESRRRGTPAPEQPGPARRRDQDHPRGLQRPEAPRPVRRRLPPHPLRRLAVQARPRLRRPPPRLDPPGHRRPPAPLLHEPWRPGRRSHGRGRDHARRLHVHGTPLPHV